MAIDRPQAERDAKARRELSRAAGVALIEMSWALEQGLVVNDGAGHTTMVLVGFAARGRRLLRSAYRLIDAGDRDTAGPLLRVLNEYVIVSRWLLQASAEDVLVWSVDDLHARLTVLREVLDDEDVPEDAKVWLKKEREHTEAEIAKQSESLPEEKPAEHCGRCGSRLTRRGRRKPPNLQAMAGKDLSFAYSYGYRLQSQYDVHATTLAVESAYDAVPSGWAVRPAPRFAMEGFDSCRSGARLLLDLLQPLSDLVPELRWADTTTMVRETLDAIDNATIASDPREPNGPS